MAETDPACVRIAVIGDVHTHWDAMDVDYFERSAYDLILFVGDLAEWTVTGGLRTARSIGRLSRTALAIPGNHDGVLALQLWAEVTQRSGLARTLGSGMARRCERLRRALGPVAMCGYSRHPFSVRGFRFSVVAARPHSSGGPGLAYGPYLRTAFGIEGIEDSAARLRQLVDDAGSDPILFLAHNGPTGLGARRSDPWGCDFRPEQGDFGDPDLRAALDHTGKQGRRILGVAAGHMHHRLRGGGTRTRFVQQDGFWLVNAARVPRIFERDGVRLRHHVAIEFDAERTSVRDVLVDPAGRTLST